MALNPFEMTVVGDALDSHGFVGNNTTDPFGLLTYGFIWQCFSLYTPGVIGTTLVPAGWTASVIGVTTPPSGWTSFIFDNNTANKNC